MDVVDLVVDLYYQAQDLKKALVEVEEQLAQAQSRLEMTDSVISTLTAEVVRAQEAPFTVTMTLRDGSQRTFSGTEAEQIVADALEVYGPIWQEDFE